MNWKRSLIAVALAAPAVALLAFGMGRNPKEIPSPLPGRPAPSFELALMDPELFPEELDPADSTAAVRLADRAGEVVILNFFASWCVACRVEHRVLSDVAERFERRGARFYGVLYQDSPENGRRWIEEMGGQSYPALLDPRSRTAIDYGLSGVPETFIIGKDGRVAYKHFGPVTEELLVQKLDSLLALPAPGAGAGS